jgi:hypothetical protein
LTTSLPEPLNFLSRNLIGQVSLKAQKEPIKTGFTNLLVSHLGYRNAISCFDSFSLIFHQIGDKKAYKSQLLFG